MWIQVSTAPYKRALKDKGEEERPTKKNPAHTQTTNKGKRK